MHGEMLFVLFIPVFSQTKGDCENMLRNKVLEKTVMLHWIFIFLLKKKTSWALF